MKPRLLSFEHDNQEEIMAKMGEVMKIGMKTQMAQMKTNQEGGCLEKMEVYLVSADWLQSHMQNCVL